MKKVLFLFLLLSLAFPFFVLAEQIDINSATLSQLDEIVHVGPIIAQRITDARPYSSVQDLSRVKGIGDGKYLQDIIDQGFTCVGCQTEIAQAQQPAIETLPEAPIEEKPAEVRPPPTYPSGVVINEILSSPEGADEDYEWIEIYNQNDFEVDLSGWKIEDAKGTKTKYTFPNGTKISIYGYLLLKRPDTKITLNNSGDGLNLFWPNDKVIDSLAYSNAPKNQSYNKTASGWQWSIALTPAAKNIIQNLSNLEKSGNSNGIEVETAAVIQSINQKGPTGYPKTQNPWFLFFTALAITIISALLVLFIKFKLHPVK